MLADLRSRRDMVATGALYGGFVTTAVWLITRELLKGDGGVTLPQPAFVRQSRNAIPFVTLAGAAAGFMVSRERWVRIPVTTSMFPEAR
jgi:hypothetical protein